MSYTSEQREKHQLLVDTEMATCTPEQRSLVMAEFIQTWPEDKEASGIIKSHKDKIALEATPAEVAEAFKNLRV